MREKRTAIALTKAEVMTEVTDEASHLIIASLGDNLLCAKRDCTTSKWTCDTPQVKHTGRTLINKMGILNR